MPGGLGLRARCRMPTEMRPSADRERGDHGARRWWQEPRVLPCSYSPTATTSSGRSPPWSAWSWSPFALRGATRRRPIHCASLPSAMPSYSSLRFVLSLLLAACSTSAFDTDEREAPDFPDGAVLWQLERYLDQNGSIPPRAWETALRARQLTIAAAAAGP